MIGLISVTWAAIFGYLQNSRQQALDNAGRNMSNLAVAFEENVLRTVGGIDQALLYMRADYQRLGGKFDPAAELRAAVSIRDLALHLGVTDAEGNMVASSLDTPVVSVKLSDREHFQVHQRGTDDVLFISKPVVGRVSGHWSLEFSRRLSGPDGSFRGVIVLSVDPFALSRFYSRVDMGDSGVVTVIGRDGFIRARSRLDEQMVTTSVGGSPLFKEASEGESGSLAFRSHFDNVERIYGYRWLSVYPLMVSVGLPVDEVLHHVRQGMWLGSALAALLTVLQGWFGVMLLRRFEGNSRRLLETTGELSREKTKLSSVNAELEHTARILTHSIEARIAAEDGRREDERRLRLAAGVFEATQEGIVITDLHGEIIAVNPAFCTITGYPEDEVIGRNPRILKSGRHDQAFYRRVFDALAADGHWQGEIWNRRKDGGIFPAWLTISAARDEQGRATNYIATSVDISQVKQSEEMFEHLAHHDPLTGLPNRLLLVSRLVHAIGLARRHQTKGALLFLDLDQFKNVNDSLGHSAGDALLQMVAQRYLARLRDSDTLCRMGGDEFVVLLENLAEPGRAATVAQSLIDELRAPFVLQDGHEVYIGTSIGISVFPDDGDEPDHLISNADAAMYQAKAAGRNTFRFYTEAMTSAANARVAMESALRRALERDELVLHYQPQVTVSGRRIVGVEALVRWQRPGFGLVPPAEFIPLAEETGLIVPIGERVLRTACKQMRQWLDAGLDLETIAVNLSALQFKRVDLPALVRTVLEEQGLPASYVELEITESVLMDFGPDAEEKLRALKQLGVRLAIDDFGTGYSSLAYLKRFPIDKLKVDRSFVRDIPEDSADMKIVSAVIALAKNLKLDVVAEGVENEAQREFLHRLECELCQGYLFSKPIDAAELADMLTWRLP